MDDIVIGAGAAGSVVAARLSEDSDRSVLVLEAGGPYRPELSGVPGYAYDTLGSDAVWANDTVPQEALQGRSLSLTTGRGIGGGSAVNGMGWFHGFPEDYDRWLADGATGWDAASMASSLRAVEDHELGAGPHHGRGGRIAVGAPPHLHPLVAAFVAAGVEHGLEVNPDLNGAKRDGIGLIPSNIRAGVRSDVVREYLVPALTRANLTVRSNSAVARVLFDGDRATGVELTSGETLEARGRVIVCAGALRTPQILMLSGFGPALHLREHGITVRRDLVGVGENLHDHPKVPAIWQRLDDAFRLDRYYDDPEGAYRLLRRGPLAALGQAIAVCRSSSDVEPADLHIMLSLLGLDTGRPQDPSPGIVATVALLDPRSRGTVRLAGPDPELPPVIDPRYLSSPEDRDRLRSGLRLAAELFSHEPLRSLLGQQLAPPPGAATAALDDHIDQHLDTYWHPVGTARMGTDAHAVVTPDLQVVGTVNLHVIDASVFPRIPRANTHAPTLALAELAASRLRAPAG